MKRFLEGKKTYISGGMLVLLGVAVALGYAEPDSDLIEGAKIALTGALGAALRVGLKSGTGK